MATVAEQLRRAREAQNLDIYQIAEITKIKTDHIRALESGDYDGFAAPVYIRGFVRTYARILKLDAASVGEVLNEELGQTERFRDPPPLVPQSGGTIDFLMLQLTRLNWRVVVALLAVGVMVILGLAGLNKWRNRATIDPLKDMNQGLYQGDGGIGTLPLPTPPK